MYPDFELVELLRRSTLEEKLFLISSYLTCEAVRDQIIYERSVKELLSSPFDGAKALPGIVYRSPKWAFNSFESKTES